VVDASSTSGTSALVEWLYRTALERSNERDAAGFAALFDDDGHVVGFDGSEMDGRAEIRSALQAIFADHETAAYVAKVRDVRSSLATSPCCAERVGMVPRRTRTLNPAVNAMQSLVARAASDGWRIVLLQNTPAQYHGRPEAVDALTAELSEQL
jgi:uncharacterized protein (TIGR02246 family)